MGKKPTEVAQYIKHNQAFLADAPHLPLEAVFMKKGRYRRSAH
jgi:hypothetical protein